MHQAAVRGEIRHTLAVPAAACSSKKLSMTDNESKQNQYLSNVALKANTKLGGINHKLAGDALGWLTQEPIILVAIDVMHPGPSSVPGMLSIAGVSLASTRTLCSSPQAWGSRRVNKRSALVLFSLLPHH